MWARLGKIYSIKNSRCQLPTLSKVGEKFHLHFSSKNEKGFSNGYRIIFDNFKQIFDLNKINHKKIISNGPIGSLDYNGVMPMQEINQHLFYIGWTQRKDVPYFNYTSVAKKVGTSFKKLGPILSPCTIDPGYSGTLGIHKIRNTYYGYYLSQISWKNDEKGELNPTYDIKIATSKDLIHWKKTGIVAIGLLKDEAGISSATVIKYKKYFHMWFSVRKSKFFRDSLKGSYQILHAHSKDGIKWKRTNYFSLKPNKNFLGEEVMTCYPNVHIFNDKIYMLYNGNGFGLSGIRLAAMKLDLLKDFN